MTDTTTDTGTHREGRSGRRSVLAGAAGMAVAGGAATVGTPSVAAAESRRSAGRFHDKVVLVTGATSGIGRAAAIAFAAEGAKVGFCGRRERLGRQVERAIERAGGEASYIPADVREPEQVRRFVDTVADRYGGLDVAFNNAGVQHPKPILRTSLQEWEDTQRTNDRGVFLCIRAELPHLIERGGGVIVCTSSINETASRPGLAAYSASKGGVLGLVRTAALEHGSDGIRVVGISPGTTDTGMVQDRRPPGISDEEWERQKREYGKAEVDALRRMAGPEETAKAVLAVAASDMTFVTGTTLVVDGGMLAGL